MKVRALTSFGGLAGAYAKGQEFELPDGADWLRAGLVEVVNVDVSPEVESSLEEINKPPMSRVGVTFTEAQKTQIQEITAQKGKPGPIVRKPSKKKKAGD